MKTQRLILIIILMVSAISLVAEGTSGLRFHFFDNYQNAWDVSRGTATDTEIVIPSTFRDLPVTRIEASGFVHFTDLTSIVLPNTITQIGNRAFRGCTNLKSINIPYGVTSIGIAAFDRCTSLTSLVLPGSLRTIANVAFSGCTNLVRIVIPESVVRIGGRAFLNCPNLTIYAEAESQPSGWDSQWNPDNRPVVWGYVIGGE